ncbi:MAG: 50S ribosomal protein L21 [Parcubacteria group bacterium CG_4_10_14_0_8_um_filter_35_7]|nr:MAG: 50S ribosomal protein L21 [Parcubacteria group bacterium CG23_combo_of_CG06-09_8_20_14_all_35_9]PIY78775.1 MAG: 50S ribosomal protein L21 [Parcubacteria group bacterium CG_4_10_14_0_8_um_filter_35_7]
MIAVIKTGGKQYKVSPGDKIKIEKIEGKKGDEVEFDEVLLISDEEGKDVRIGNPYLKDAKVKAEILEQGRAKKITVVKYKRKIRYRRKVGYRQSYTKIEVKKISF